VIGDGGWGTTLAIILHKKGYKIKLWSAFKDYAGLLDKRRINTKFLSGVKIPKGILITDSLKEAVLDADLIILAVPSQYLRNVLIKLRIYNEPGKIFLSVVKGIETSTLKRMSEVVFDVLGKVKLAVLSGPTIAYEVARYVPTTAVVASKDIKLAKEIQDILITDRFRVYTNSDVIGVELGGSLKNIIAIACGISDGLRFGTNTKAAILSRGLAEITRLGVVLGAEAKTFSGISGLGDLVTTCISPFSRNRYVGEQIGRGRKLKDILKDTEMVAEGVPTAKSAYFLSRKHKVDMPIIKEIYLVLYKNKTPIRAVDDLMLRRRKSEF
ncbi:MAG TPA: NAD(P)H-dependent glycerol-3-phosphate dehydrogenase, partial [Candidatus Omnitrophota bacterium]|nr:NAD(P)H-dependent glycerol-3-phosphate dehydrogenase [Candidatus Omnitrophota bacterium]